MKKYVRVLKILLIAVLMFTSITAVNAAGSSTLGFSGPSSVEVGKEIEIVLNISNLSSDGGVVAVQGALNFDTAYLEYVSNQNLAPFAVSYATGSKKLAGVDFMKLTPITGNSDIMKFTFKALKTGSTTISLTGYEISDAAGDILTTTSNSKTITITSAAPAKSDNAYLSSLGVTGYTISPSFDKTKTSYTLTVPNSVSSVTVTGTAEDTKATVSGTGSKSLSVGTNNVSVTVTAEDGTTTKTYTIAITREAGSSTPSKSSDNTLKNLAVSGYTISPSFNKDTLEYSVTVPNDATEIIVNATKNDDKATVTISGNENLKVGENTVTVTVTAEDGSKKTYTIKVTKKDKEEETETKLDGDATLSKLNVGGYTLSPTFNKDKNVYSMTVQSTVTGLKVDAIPTSSKASVSISGASGWKYGVNTVSIVVTAENGNKNTYIVNVTRKDPNTSSTTPEKSDDSYLDGITLGGGVTLSPKFDKDVSNYTVTLPYDMEDLEIDYDKSNSKAKVEVIGNKDLQVGNNAIQIKVTAEDGSVRVYTINATRSAVASGTDLKSLSVAGFTLSPSFDKNIRNYSLKVDGNTSSIDVIAIAENSDAKIEISGDKDLKVGNNVVRITVTDKNGYTKDYYIEVERPDSKVGGMSIGQLISFILLGLSILGVIALLLLLLKRKSKDDDKTPSTPQQPVTPVIDFKPEFNIGSRNGTDDDVVHPHGTLNQNSQFETEYKDSNRKLLEAEDPVELNYLDETITKDELISAIREGMETKDTDKLKMLLKQDELNQLKKEIKRKEEAKSRGNYED